MSDGWTADLVTIEPTMLTQQHFGGPRDEPGWVPGDCYRTAIGCLVACSRPDQVPHFAEMAEACPGPMFGWHAIRLARQWLRHELDIDLMVITPEAAAGYGVPYVATVDSVAGPWLHCVLAQSGEVIHDPSGKLDSHIGAEIMQAEVLVAMYDPEPDAMVRWWTEDLCKP